MILPGAMSNSIDYLLTFQWKSSQRQDVAVVLTEPSSGRFHDLENLPGVIRAEPIRSVPARLRFGQHERKLSVTGISPGSSLHRLLDHNEHPVEVPLEGLLMSEKLAEILGVEMGEVVTTAPVLEPPALAR